MATPSPTKNKGWTEREKYTFLLKIIGQLGGKNGTLKGVNPKFDEIDLEGRTSKAMSLMWNKIKNETPVSDGSGTNAPPSTPHKRKANGDAAGTPASKKKTPSKKGKKGKKGKGFDDSEDDDELEMPELGDTDEEDPVLTKYEEEDDSEDFVATKNEAFA